MSRKKQGKPGRPAIHAGYAYLVKANEAIPLTAARENLIQDLGPTEQDLTAAQIILIDRVITKLGIVRCIEEHIRETSVMQGHNLAPSLRQSYLAYNNSIRLDLQSLGINKRAESIIDPIKYIQGDSQGDDDNKRGE